MMPNNKKIKLCDCCHIGQAAHKCDWCGNQICLFCFQDVGGEIACVECLG